MKRVVLQTWWLASFLFLTGCSSTVVLAPAAPATSGVPRIQRNVGIHHSRQFQSAQQSIDVYGNHHEFVFDIGAASDKLLRTTYGLVFERHGDLTQWPPGAALAGNLDAIMKVELEDFRFPMRGTKGPYWAEVSYRFTLQTPDGREIGAWRTRGWGESGDGTVFGEFGPIAAALDQAMASAARKFAASFRNVPELARWAAGKESAGVTAAPELQRTGAANGFGAGGREGAYDGVVVVKAQLSRIKDGATREGGRAQPNDLVAIRLLVRNEGSGAIAFDPSQLELLLADERRAQLVPAGFVAAALTTRYGRLGPVATGPGFGPLPNLIFSLANVAADSAERSELQRRLAEWRRAELRDSILGAGASLDGQVFLLLPSALPVDAELRLPVIALDSATRYIVSIRLQEAPAE